MHNQPSHECLTSCSSFSLSANHPHSAIPHVDIFNIASVYCWYLQHPARVASFRSSEHGGGLGDINAVVSVVLIDVQISAKLANLIEYGQIGA